MDFGPRRRQPRERISNEKLLLTRQPGAVLNSRTQVGPDFLLLLKRFIPRFKRMTTSIEAELCSGICTSPAAGADSSHAGCRTQRFAVALLAAAATFPPTLVCIEEPSSACIPTGCLFAELLIEASDRRACGPTHRMCCVGADSQPTIVACENRPGPNCAGPRTRATSRRGWKTIGSATPHVAVGRTRAGIR